MRNKLTCVTTYLCWHVLLSIQYTLSGCIMDFLKNRGLGNHVNDHVLEVTSSSSCLFRAVSSLAALSWKASWASLSLSSHSSWCCCLQREHNKTLLSTEPPRPSMLAFITGYKDCWVTPPLLARGFPFTHIIFFILFLLLRHEMLSIFNR